MAYMSTSELLVAATTLRWRNQTYACAIGQGGFSAHKREGDGATPLGRFPLRQVLYRADRLALPPLQLPVHAIRSHDSWCDIPTHTHYNQLIAITEGDTEHTQERLWRDDHIYDIVVPLGYNDAPAIPGKGSAVFIHVARPGYPPTAGCIALAKQDLLQLLPQLDSATICHTSAAPADA
jgi:L,D-peptidoglycan transpeptidase YkuD (ErfK/YbiS/YcfS/YnhG family)